MLKVPPRCSEPIFSQALAELEAIHGKAYRNYTDDHTKLFLTVQTKALWAGHSFDTDGAPRSHWNAESF